MVVTTCFLHHLHHTGALLPSPSSARLLQQDPVAIAKYKGQQPAGLYAMTGENAEAGAGSNVKGARYNSGIIQTTGDAAAGPVSVTTSAETNRAGWTRSGGQARQYARTFRSNSKLAVHAPYQQVAPHSKVPCACQLMVCCRIKEVQTLLK